MIAHNKTPRQRLRWVLLGLLALSGLWFYTLERLIPVPVYWLHSRLDNFIPFLPVFVIPYCVWYLYVAAPAVYTFFKHPDEFAKIGSFLLIGMTIACSVYTLLPNGQPLRPTELGGGPFNALIGFLYAIDTPTNSAPSLHVIYALAAHGALITRNARSKNWRWVQPLSLALMALIILSTVFIKQHSIIDLLSGLLVGSLLYFAVYGRTSPAMSRLRVSLAK